MAESASPGRVSPAAWSVPTARATDGRSRVNGDRTAGTSLNATSATSVVAGSSAPSVAQTAAWARAIV